MDILIIFYKNSQISNKNNKSKIFHTLVHNLTQTEIVILFKWHIILLCLLCNQFSFLNHIFLGKKYSF